LKTLRWLPSRWRRLRGLGTLRGPLRRQRLPSGLGLLGCLADGPLRRLSRCEFGRLPLRLFGGLSCLFPLGRLLGGQSRPIQLSGLLGSLPCLFRVNRLRGCQSCLLMLSGLFGGFARGILRDQFGLA
jgi:hypothetical protein